MTDDGIGASALTLGCALLSDIKFLRRQLRYCLYTLVILSHGLLPYPLSGITCIRNNSLSDVRPDAVTASYVLRGSVDEPFKSDFAI